MTENVVVGTRLLFENERIRVWDITLEPGKRLPLHRHRTSYFYRCLRSSSRRSSATCESRWSSQRR